MQTEWSDDGCTLTVHRPVDEQRVWSRTYSWPQPPSAETVLDVLTDTFGETHLEATGSGHDIRRFQLGGGWQLFTHHDWGPPRWVLPRVRMKVRWRKRSVTIDCGRGFHCYGLTVQAPR